MTGDGSSIGSKFGICFVGDWVWGMKDFIDTSFMKLMDPTHLFEDYETHGTKYPLPNYGLFEEETEEMLELMRDVRQRVKEIDAKSASELLGCPSREKQFLDKLEIIMRMNTDEEFRDEVVKHFSPPYLIK